MTNWKDFVKEDTLNWLLEDENPSVKYFTLVDLLKKPSNDSEVIDAKNNIMKIGVVPKILSKQNPGGYWGIEKDFYVRSKYKGTVWTLIILAEMGADGNNSDVKKACEFVFIKVISLIWTIAPLNTTS